MNTLQSKNIYQNIETILLQRKKANNNKDANLEATYGMKSRIVLITMIFSKSPK